jgi:SIR2-like domain
MGLKRLKYLPNESVAREFAQIYEDQIRFFSGLDTAAQTRRPAPFSRKELAPLLSAAASRKLTIVVGAGVSVPLKLPDWPSLTGAILAGLFTNHSKRTIDTLIKGNNSSAPVLTRFMENESRMKAVFRIKLKEELYGNFNRKMKSLTLASIAKLLDPNYNKKPISHVITYNFDDLLEIAISGNCKTLKFDSVYSEHSYTTSRRRVKIFHPHGYLPLEGNEDYLTSTFVFSEKEYHYQSIQPDNWANVIQRRLYSTQTCLFIGISFTDPNLRRILDTVRLQAGGTADPPRHYCVRKIASGSNGKLTDLQNYFVEKDLQSFGVEPIWVNSYDQLPKLLTQLRFK